MQELCIGLFLSDELIVVMSGVTLPNVRIFGFQIPAQVSLASPQYFRSPHGNTMSMLDWDRHGVIQSLMLVPSENVGQLAQVLPCLHTFKVMYSNTYAITYSIHIAAILEASFMSPDVFPSLCSIICCCEGLRLEFKNASPLCQIVRKF